MALARSIPTAVDRAAGDDKLPLDHPLYAWRCPASAIRQTAAENRLGQLTDAYDGSMLLPVSDQPIDAKVIRATARPQHLPDRHEPAHGHIS